MRAVIKPRSTSCVTFKTSICSSVIGVPPVENRHSDRTASPRAVNWLATLLIALLLSTSYLLDGPDDTATAQAVADDLADAVQTAKPVHTAQAGR